MTPLQLLSSSSTYCICCCAGPGWERIQGLLQATPQELGVVVPTYKLNGHEFVAKRFLGSSGNASVYAVKSEGGEQVGCIKPP
jgi:hypothetical protein